MTVEGSLGFAHQTRDIAHENQALAFSAIAVWAAATSALQL